MAVTGFSNYLENKVLDHCFGGSPFAQPAVYVALYTADPDEDGSGAECVGGSYVRKPTTFAAASGGGKATNATITWPNMPACVVTHVGIWDALTNGNFLAGGALTASKVVGAGDTFEITSGNLTITLN